jgi:hypothetical protein
MNFAHARKNVRPLSPSGLFLICLALLLGGCQASKPSLSPEAQALKTKLLGELDKLTPKLTEPVAQQDWPAAEAILQTAFNNMHQEAKLVPETIVALDRNAIIRVRFPSKEQTRFDFSNYTLAKTVFKEKKKVQGKLYLEGMKIFVVLAPLLQKNDLVGGVALAFPADALEKQWHVSEQEFLSINLNQ